MSIASTIRALFNPPDVTAEASEQRARIFFRVWRVLATGLTLFVSSYIAFDRSRNILPLSLLGLGIVVSFISHRRGLPRAAASVLSWSLLASILGMAIFNGGLRATALWSLPMFLVIIALLLEGRQFILLSALSIVSIAALGSLHLNGILSNPGLRDIGFADTMYLIAINLGTVILARLTTSYLMQSLAKIREDKGCLDESETKYRELFDHVIVAVFRTTLEGKIVTVNPAFAHMFGYDSPEELIALVNDASGFHADPDQREAIIRMKPGNSRPIILETPFRRKDGSTFLGRLHLQRWRMPGNGTECFQGFIEDISERKMAEEALVKSQDLIKAIVNSTTDMIWSVDTERFSLQMFNDGHSAYFKANRNLDIKLGDEPERLLPTPESARTWRDFYGRALAGGRYTTEYRTVVGASVLQLTFNPLMRDGKAYGISVFGRDISEAKRAEERIRRSLEEKEALLHELYHRTKNNMAMIVSLLKMQADMADDAALAADFKKAQNRIGSMALVQENLYKTQDLSHIALDGYIADLVALLADTYHDTSGNVSLKLSLESVSVLTDSAIPCGLVLNELITNSLVHAFPDGHTGEIRVSLHSLAGGLIQIEVADDGVGLPERFDFRSSGRLGAQNVFALVEHQLCGKVSIDLETGVRWSIEFPDDQHKPRKSSRT